MKTTEGVEKPNEHSEIPSSSMWTASGCCRKEGRLCRTNTKKPSLISSSNEGREAKKICRVCGDKAFSYNFNVISCESCKAFFRRNASKQKEIRCPFNNSCNITKLSRRFCQRCRLQKCFDVGMKKEWIMSEKARLEKRQRIIANRERRAAEIGSICSEKPDTTSDYEETNVFGIERPSSLLPDETSRMSTDTLTAFTPFASSNYDDQDTPRTEDSATTSNFDLPNLQNTDSFSTVFPPTSFSPNSSPVTNLLAANTLMKTPLKSSSPLAFNTPQDCGIATQQVQLSTQIRRAAEIEQYIQQHSTIQTVLQPFSNGFPHSESSSETVTVPRQTLMKLIQQSTTSQNQVPLPPGHENMGVPPKCQCVCICGRYRPGSLIVDEVMKEILANPICQSRSKSSKNQCDKKTGSEVTETDTVLFRTYDLATEGYNLEADKDSAQSAKSLSTCVQKDTSKNQSKQKSSLLEEELNAVRVDPDCCLMTSADQDRLGEVISACSTWSENDFDTTEWINKRCTTVYDLLNLIDKAIHKMIKMTKRIATFQKIEHHDQIHLLKGASMELIILRSAFCYVPNKQCWENPDSNSRYLASLDLLQEFPENLLNHFIRLYSLFRSELRTNKYVMSLLGMLVLFNPDTRNLKNPSAVNDEQIQYRKVLKRLLYTLCNHDQLRTNNELTVLLSNIYELRKLAEKVQRIITGIDRKKLQPLLLEMFCE